MRHIKAETFEQFASMMAILTGLAAFLYAVSFIIISRSDPATGGFLSALFLTLVGFCSTGAFVGLYQRLKDINPSFALWGLFIAMFGAAGSLLHGAYDLANSINPPLTMAKDLPSQVDPRGILTFALIGVAIFKLSWLITKDKKMPKELGYLGFVSAVLLMIIYLGRLIVLNPASPIILYPVLLNGFIVYPLWYLWLGKALWKNT